MKRFVPLLVAAGLLVPALSAKAQAGLSFWAGYAQSSDSGAVLMETKGVQAGVQLGLPLVPIAFRADARHWERRSKPTASRSWPAACCSSDFPYCSCMDSRAMGNSRPPIQQPPTGGRRVLVFGWGTGDLACLARCVGLI